MTTKNVSNFVIRFYLNIGKSKNWKREIVTNPINRSHNRVLFDGPAWLALVAATRFGLRAVCVAGAWRTSATFELTGIAVEVMPISWFDNLFFPTFFFKISLMTAYYSAKKNQVMRKSNINPSKTTFFDFQVHDDFHVCV